MQLRFRTTAWALAFALAAMGCGGTERPDDGNTHNPPAPKVPDPGTQPMSFNWADAEPNDTAETATPLGVAGTGEVDTWVDGNGLGGTDKADFFVFRSGPEAAKFFSRTCWSGGTNLADLYLYKVVDGQPLTAVLSSTDTGTGCENTADNVMLEPNTKYLLEVRNVDGSGQYAA